MPGKLEGKVAVITGAGSGLGRAGAILFAQEGAMVVIADVDEQGMRGTAHSVAANGGSAITMKVDVSRSTEISAMIGDTIATCSQIDILWNNAGVAQSPFYGNIEDLPESEWDRVIGINLKGVWLGCRAVIPHMKRVGSGVIINTASTAGLIGDPPGMSIYCASKGGVVQITRELAAELIPHNIRVNAIAPGGMNTPLVGDHSQARTVTNRTDANRMAEPEEVAQTALFLAGDNIGPLTGSIVSHDGGMSSTRIR